MADTSLTEIEADLLRSGLAQPVRIFGELIPIAEGLSNRGLALEESRQIEDVQTS